MKCKCPSENHGHKAGKCKNLATEPDHMCKQCHEGGKGNSRPRLSEKNRTEESDERGLELKIDVASRRVS